MRQHGTTNVGRKTVILSLILTFLSSALSLGLILPGAAIDAWAAETTPTQTPMPTPTPIPATPQATQSSTPAGTASAVDSPITIQTRVDRAKIKLGDVFTYTLSIHSKAGVQVMLPGWGANLGQFEIRDYKTSESKNKDGSVTGTSIYYLAVYDTGKFTIPPVMVPYKLPGETENRQLASDSVAIEVESIASTEAKDIRGLKTQAAIPPDYRLVYLVAGLALFLALVTGGIIYAVRRSRRKKQLQAEPFVGPPHEVAIQELEALLASGLLEQNRIKEFYFELSEIVRRYLGRRFQIYTLERTTTEIMEQLEKLFLSESAFGMISSFLNDTDLVKFARYIPPRGEIDGDVARARIVIESTKPITPVVAAPGESSQSSSPPADRAVPGSDNPGDASTDQADNPAITAVGDSADSTPPANPSREEIRS
jgi:hypothetical protein